MEEMLIFLSACFGSVIGQIIFDIKRTKQSVEKPATQRSKGLLERARDVARSGPFLVTVSKKKKPVYKTEEELWLKEQKEHP